MVHVIFLYNYYYIQVNSITVILKQLNRLIKIF